MTSEPVAGCPIVLDGRVVVRDFVRVPNPHDKTKSIVLPDPAAYPTMYRLDDIGHLIYVGPPEWVTWL